MSARRVVAALLAMMLGAAVVSVLPSAPPAAAAGTPTDSALTKSGSGEFKDLKVTVSQTTNLINQVVTVSWAGGAPTTPVGGFSRNYLQIMQCWGDDPNGPDRTECQFGGSNTQGAGTWVQSRQVSYDSGLVDAKETLKKEGFGGAFVPFWAAGKDPPPSPADGDTNDFFDSQVTNEISLARTHSDHTGLEYFEIQTVRQAAGLGCGDPVTVGGATKARSCWLVIVPRGGTEVDGSTRNDTNQGRQQSSPLSQTNWDNRIVFPLEFLPVGQACPIGGAERRVLGNELVADAVSSWQPALCTGGALYSYTQLGDDVVRNQLLGGSSPGLAVVTNPIPPDQAPAGNPLVYAPVGLSGLAIAFNIERQPPDPTDPTNLTPEQKLDGQRFTSLKLTPRLVAKLLTQSYLAAVQVPSDSMNKHNPPGLLFDPEFLDLNPDYKGSVSDQKPLPDALVQLGGADVTSLLWSWVKADPEASAFLGGMPDPSGMVVNPNNQNLPLPTLAFPRNDQSCTDLVFPSQGNVHAPLCTQDVHPFTNDMHDAGRSASRGDSQERTITADSGQPLPKKQPRQQAGKRALLAVVDAATATRYGLPMAALRNAAGKFVAPTTESLQAGEAAMKPSVVASVLAADPSATDPATYPLTALSYAMASPSTLDAPAGKDYAAFLRYAAGPGQQPGVAPGQLPLGMVPLPDALKAQTIAAAATIEAQAGKTPGGPPPQSPISAVSPIGRGAGSTGGSTMAPGTPETPTAPGGGAGARPPGVTPPPTGSVSKTPNVAQQPVARVRRTPPVPAPAVGALLLTILICGALAATSSPVLQSPVINRISAAIRRRLGKEMAPTEK